MPFSLPLIDAALRGMVLSWLLLMAGLLLRDRPRLPAAQAGLLLALGMVVQVFSSAPSFERQVSCAAQSPLVGVAVANAMAFWFFVRALFDDDFRWRGWHAGAWLFAFTVGTLNCGLVVGEGDAVALTLRVLLRTVPLAGVLLAIRAAVLHWRDDLVEARRRLRAFVLVTGVVYTLAQLWLRLSSAQGRLSDSAALLDVAGLLLIAAGVVWRLVHLTQSDLFPQALLAGTPTPAPCINPVPDARAAAPADRADRADRADPQASVTEFRPLEPPDLADTQLADALQRLMHDQRAYRAENLTVAGLAARLAVPEYRLRRHINQRLGHRNFNAYVNGYRLAEAQAALADPARRDLPVLTVALTAGFQSIGPFNRAFKAATGRTPTEFRKENQADS